jgi:hypothetical protein
VIQVVERRRANGCPNAETETRLHGQIGRMTMEAECLLGGGGTIEKDSGDLSIRDQRHPRLCLAVRSIANPETARRPARVPPAHPITSSTRKSISTDLPASARPAKLKPPAANPPHCRSLTLLFQRSYISTCQPRGIDLRPVDSRWSRRSIGAADHARQTEAPNMPILHVHMNLQRDADCENA